jgi:hypothetical protein
VDRSLVEVGLGVEVAVEVGLGDAHPFGDVAQPGTVEPALDENVPGSGEDHLPPGGGGQALARLLVLLPGHHSRVPA